MYLFKKSSHRWRVLYWLIGVNFRFVPPELVVQTTRKRNAWGHDLLYSFRHRPSGIRSLLQRSIESNFNPSLSHLSSKANKILTHQTKITITLALTMVNDIWIQLKQNKRLCLYAATKIFTTRIWNSLRTCLINVCTRNCIMHLKHYCIRNELVQDSKCPTRLDIWRILTTQPTILTHFE